MHDIVFHRQLCGSGTCTQIWLALFPQNSNARRDWRVWFQIRQSRNAFEFWGKRTSQIWVHMLDPHSGLWKTILCTDSQTILTSVEFTVTVCTQATERFGWDKRLRAEYVLFSVGNWCSYYSPLLHKAAWDYLSVSAIDKLRMETTRVLPSHQQSKIWPSDYKAISPRASSPLASRARFTLSASGERCSRETPNRARSRRLLGH